MFTIEIEGLLNILKNIVVAIIFLIAIYYIFVFLNFNILQSTIYFIWVFVIIFFIYFLGGRKPTWKQVLNIRE